MKRVSILLLLFHLVNLAMAQTKTASSSLPVFTPSELRLKNTEIRKKMLDNSTVKNIAFRNVGPTVMSGRVTDLEVDPADPTHFYVAYASGGLWETKNNGTSYEPLFDNEIVMSIGDIAVNWKTKTIYVGTGENNSSRSSYSGVGLFKSTDNGKSWSHLGLSGTQHIGRIVLHPSNDRIIWVAAMGNLYSSNPDRGVYKTNNGGHTWSKTFFLNEYTGAIDLVIDPAKPDRLLVSMWQRDRKAWNFNGSGQNGGIYKSEDGGQHWKSVIGKETGFPSTKGTGRIGLAIAPSNPNIIYAFLDNQDRIVQEEQQASGLTKSELRKMKVATFLALDDSLLNDYLRENGFPEEYDCKEVKRLVKANKARPASIANYFEDANAKLFNTPVKGAEMYRSNDGGGTWSKTHNEEIEDMYYSYGYYFGEVRVDAKDPDKVYALGVPIIKSDNGGKTWININGDNQHGDHQALWVNPNRSGHLINGNDGGVNISYDDGQTWSKSNPAAVGQFYDINYDMAEPYNIYGGLQDNGVWFGPSTYAYSKGWENNGAYPWKRLLGGDGMQTEIDTRDDNIVYTGYQFGHYFRIDKTTMEKKKITPMHKLGEKMFRWNWEAPIHLSRHNQDIIYMGSNRFHRSMNQGELFETTSGDLTKGGKKGNVSYGTMTVIAESPMKFGLIYIGTDDGVVQLSTDGGNQWIKIDPNLSKDMWVSSIVPSKYKEGRVYLTLNGYRWDKFDAMVYVSENYGKVWRKLGTDLPREPVNVIVEDPVNENILYLGTDHGLYTSLNRGVSFMRFQNGLPNVAVHDLAIHPRELDLIVGTHGRSVYVGDIKPVQLLASLSKKETLKTLPIADVVYSKSWGDTYWGKSDDISAPITFYSNVSGLAVIKLYEDERLMYEKVLKTSKGLTFFNYDLSRNGEAAEDGTEPAPNGKVYLTPYDYQFEITIGEVSQTVVLKVVEEGN
jgi:photosystem II stability/assembly factor-like uncharacterized protein